ncbi:uncharacterized protein KY384_003569 [Bacidia gigantensis]|uniref:uncharacterized protein n=1 Tax=Bacidia gigantensis TaxID=2732470 RepID=UPI001D04DAC7|nr:uncharacterized protein KY384_003569 [Bacidia gigantensis]KAG8531933.1 hypothetical protein KY384_003569 [Bacidia gigantensis]
MEDITDKFKEVKAKEIPRERLAQVNKEKGVQFKATIVVLATFFFYITLLHGLGIFLFTKGFLLTRLVLNEKSDCSSPPLSLPSHAEPGCWHPQTFTKAVVIIIDALRYDFTVPRPGSTHHFHNALHVLHETATQYPAKAFLLPFIADPPTTTLQRLKGLTTGTLPTFIDAGSNFAGTAIEEDNLVAQLKDAGRRIVHLGDDTWHSLFPGYFDTNLTRAYDSFNVWDLFTVDNGVTEHLFPLLEGTKKSNWDVIFGHYLGVDHAGHRYGPDHPATKAKLEEMDSVVRRMVDTLDEDTLLVVMGDHGMDVKGDHGGESDDEVEAALWMYSKKAVFGRGHNGFLTPPPNAKDRPVGQIDLVPTLGLLLGMPIPFNNLGAPIAEAFVGAGRPNWENLATVNALAAAQINRYQRAYSQARGLSDAVFSLPKDSWIKGFEIFQSALQGRNTKQFGEAYEAFALYQQQNLQICRSLWARFDIPNMIVGVFILAGTLLILAYFARCQSMRGAPSASEYLPSMAKTGAATLVAALLGEALIWRTKLLDASLGGLAVGSILGFVVAFMRLPYDWEVPSPTTVWGWMAVVMTISQSIGFASNSYTIWEDEILFFFLVAFAAMTLLSSARRANTSERIYGIMQSLIFGVLTLLASFSRLCREEQMPYCRSTYYASTTSSTSAPWQLLIPLVTATLLPSVVKAYYKRTSSYEGIATIWIGFVLRIGLLAVAIFWLLDAADDNNWLTLDTATLKTIKIVLARLVLGVSLVGGASAWIYAKPCISIQVEQKYDDSIAEPKKVQIYGSLNAHGTRYFLLVITLLIGLSLLQKPMGIGSLTILTIQILSLMEIIHVNDLSKSAIGPVVLAALGSFHFFKTGHQATLSSIQWESAFIPLSVIQYPFSPLLVVANTYGAQILTAAAVPLIAVWKRPARRNGLLGDVSNALGTFLLYHATINLATTMWAGHLRRHLMLYRIFSPRFMTAAGLLLVLDLIVILVAWPAFWFNMHSISEIFGWT